MIDKPNREQPKQSGHEQPGHEEQGHEQLRHELEYSALLMRANLARRHESARVAAIGLAVAGVLGAVLAVVLLVSGSGGESVPPPPSAPSTSAGPPAAARRADRPPVLEAPRPSAPPVSGPVGSGPGASGPVSEYSVRRGDTLARIALRHRVPTEQIAADNNIVDPHRVAPGQRLVIRTAPPGVEVIAPGSTLAGYARRHGLRVSELLALNPHLTDPNRIRAGGRLRVRP